MNTDAANQFKIADLTVTRVLAQLLDRLENSTKPVGAAQYRSVVNHLVNELHVIPHGAELGALLDAHPAAAELYENLYYDVAGRELVLSRSSLDASLAAERLARDSIQRAMHGEPKGGLHGQVRS
jgi:sirohydrochlorin ferrochelatase